MSVNQNNVPDWVVKSALASAQSARDVFAENPPHITMMWTRECLHAVGQVAVTKGDRAKVAAVFYSLYEAVENETPLPDFKNFAYQPVPVPPKLTVREQLSRWWAERSESFYAGVLVGFWLGGALATWAAHI